MLHILQPDASLLIEFPTGKDSDVISDVPKGFIDKSKSHGIAISGFNNGDIRRKEGGARHILVGALLTNLILANRSSEPERSRHPYPKIFLWGAGSTDLGPQIAVDTSANRSIRTSQEFCPMNSFKVSSSRIHS